MARRTATWLARLLYFLGAILFGTLTVGFGIVVAYEASDPLADTGDIGMLALILFLIPVCAGLATGCAWLFYESFREG
jgi:hypothetical protein